MSSDSMNLVLDTYLVLFKTLSLTFMFSFLKRAKTILHTNLAHHDEFFLSNFTHTHIGEYKIYS